MLKSPLLEAGVGKSTQRKFRMLFNKGEEEPVLDYFNCAVQKDILLQGTMYMTRNYLGFHSNIFGHQTLVLKTMEELRSVSKRATLLVFDTAMEVETFSGEKIMFRSFLSRNKAFKLLSLLLEMVNVTRPEFPDPDKKPSLTRPSSSLLFVNSDAYLALRHGHTLVGPPRRMRVGTLDSHDYSDEEEEEEEGEAAGVVVGSGRKLQRAAGRRAVREHGSDVVCIPTPHADEDEQKEDGGDQEDGEEEIVEIEVFGTGTAEPESDEDDSDAPTESLRYTSEEIKKLMPGIMLVEKEEEEAVISEFEQIFSDVEMQVILQRDFPLGVSNFFVHLLGDNAEFSLAEFYKASGHKNVEISNWTDSELGNVRQISFMAEVTGAGPFAAGETRVNRAQRYRFLRHNVLLLDVESSSLDVPYADAFRLVERWEIRPLTDTAGCRAVVSFGIRWLKSVWMVKGVIASRALSDTQSGLEQWAEKAHAALKKIQDEYDQRTVPKISRAPSSEATRLQVPAQHKGAGVGAGADAGAGAGDDDDEENEDEVVDTLPMKRFISIGGPMPSMSEVEFVESPRPPGPSLSQKKDFDSRASAGKKAPVAEHGQLYSAAPAAVDAAPAPPSAGAAVSPDNDFSSKITMILLGVIIVMLVCQVIMTLIVMREIRGLQLLVTMQPPSHRPPPSGTSHSDL